MARELAPDEKQTLIDLGQDEKFLWYLGSPYSSPDSVYRELRFQQASKAAGDLMADGLFLFCPIAMSHPMAEYGSIPHMGEVWYNFDNVILDRCDGILVLMLEGWDKSKGLLAEIDRMKEQGKTVVYVEPNTLAWFTTPEASDEAVRTLG